MPRYLDGTNVIFYGVPEDKLMVCTKCGKRVHSAKFNVDTKEHVCLTCFSKETDVTRISIEDYRKEKKDGEK